MQYDDMGRFVESDENAVVAAAGRSGTLPRTGGSHIQSNVLLGLALVLVGAVLVLAMRRNDSVHGRPSGRRKHRS